MFSSVVLRGCCPVWTAYCSAGRPNASKPIVCSTLRPIIRWYRAKTSVLMKPSGCPTCRPEPDGYGNMSWTNSLSLGTGWPSTASGPTGFGAWKVPWSAQWSCHRCSICPASAAV